MRNERGLTCEGANVVRECFQYDISADTLTYRFDTLFPKNAPLSEVMQIAVDAPGSPDGRDLSPDGRWEMRRAAFAKLGAALAHWGFAWDDCVAPMDVPGMGCVFLDPNDDWRDD